MPPTAELVGRVGRLTGQHPATQEGLTLSVRVLPGRGQGVQLVTACALTADTLGLATQQGEVYAVHLSKQRYVCLDSLQSPCTSASFMTRLSRRLFVGCADGVVQCYDVSASSRLAQLPGHRTAVVCLSTKSDTEQLLSASADAVLLWDMATFRQRRMLGEAPYGSSQAVFSPAGNLLAAATPSGSITLWDSKHLRELGRLQTPLGQQQMRFNSSSISISPDEQWLVVGCKAPALLLWYSLHDWELQYAVQLPADMFGVVQVQVLPDSTSAAGACASNSEAECVYLVHASAADLCNKMTCVVCAGPLPQSDQLCCCCCCCSADKQWLHQLCGPAAAQHHWPAAAHHPRLQGSQLQHRPTRKQHGCGVQ